jgi:hypothetical protein
MTIPEFSIKRLIAIFIHGDPDELRARFGMAKGQVTRRQKDISRMIREKKQVPPRNRIRKGGKKK